MAARKIVCPKCLGIKDKSWKTLRDGFKIYCTMINGYKRIAHIYHVIECLDETCGWVGGLSECPILP